MTPFAFRPFPERLREESVQQGIGKRQENKDRSKYLVYSYNIKNCSCCSNSTYLEAPFSRLHSVLHRHRASMQTYSLPLPIHPPPNACTHSDRRSTKGRVRSTMFLKQKMVHSWTTQCAISQGNSTMCTLNISTSRDSW